MKISKELISSLSKKLGSKDLVVFDLETNGIDTNIAEIISFCAVRINRCGTYTVLQFKCKPKNQVPPEVTKINGITNESLTNEKSFSHYIADIVDLMSGCNFSGYNINKFDVKILDRQLSENGVKDFFKNKSNLDAYTVYTLHNSRNLASAYKYYTGNDIKDAHDASGDVLSTIAIIDKQLDRENLDVDSVIRKLNKDNKDGKDSKQFIIKQNNTYIINFGKNKGLPITQVDKGFLKWMLSKDFSKEVKDIVRDFV